MALRRRAVVTAVGLAAAAATIIPTAAGGPLKTGIVDGFASVGNRDAIQFDRVRALGGSVVRITLYWHSVAPDRRPRNFQAANPAEPAYQWGSYDRKVRLARARGLQPILSIAIAPRWAEGRGVGPTGTVRPNPTAFGKFARAAARRYSGRFVPAGETTPLPRVAYWMAWNEPNRHYFLRPQYVRGQIFSAAWYRRMVRSFATSVHAVNRGNVVVAGGLAPLGVRQAPAPLAFMRTMFCLSRSLRPTCALHRSPLAIDAWSHHPYTSGGPTHSAPGRDDVSLGDLPAMRRVLDAAKRLGHVRARGGVRFWVTEFAWDSRPPDPRALPATLHARWTSEALYRMWRNGVSVVTWFKLRDDPLRATPYQSGMYTVGGRRKRSFTAFRFPVVALTKSGGVYVWGRTPTSRPGGVVVQLKSGRRWRTLGTLRASSYGIFQKTYRTPFRKGHVRARFNGEASVPFSLTYVRDRYVNPFGCGGGIRC